MRQTALIPQLEIVEASDCVANRLHLHFIDQLAVGHLRAAVLDEDEVQRSALRERRAVMQSD